MSTKVKLYLKEELFNQDLPFILWEVCQSAYKDGSPWTKEQFSMDLKLEYSHYIIVMDENQYVGFVSYHLILDEAEITHLAVKQSFQAKGYGERLLIELNKSLKQQAVQQLFLEVRCSNIPAQKLYQKYGFERITIRKNYYSHPKEDALIMCLKLRK